jgi:hypothetical protein
MDLKNSDVSVAEDGDVVSFSVRAIKVLNEELSDPRASGTRPLYDQNDGLVGFFVMKSGGYAKLFLAKDAQPFGLHIGTGLDLYFTLRVTTDAKHPYGRISGVLSEVPLNDYSVRVQL